MEEWVEPRRIDTYFPLMTDAQQLRETEKFFHQQIPITRAMGVRVAAYDGQRFTLVAPIALNFNHLGTAFGGSLSAVATLAGYGLLWPHLSSRHPPEFSLVPTAGAQRDRCNLPQAGRSDAASIQGGFCAA